MTREEEGRRVDVRAHGAALGRRADASEAAGRLNAVSAIVGTEAEAHDSRFAAELKDVVFSYGKQPFIQGLSAGFRAGCITSIVGPNGCGKSTLVKLVNGMLRPSAGQVLVGGRPAAGFAPKQRALMVATLAQSMRPPAMTVEALVACGRYPHQGLRGRMGAEDRCQVEQAMELAGVADFRNHDVRTLSGGERQRACIAMTLAQDTPTIMLDEPTTYLDIGACHELMALVRRLNREHSKTVVMVIHDLDLALRYSDRLLVMQRGSRLGEGAVDEVLASGSLEQAFDVTIRAHDDPEGRAYTVYRRQGVAESSEAAGVCKVG